MFLYYYKKLQPCRFFLAFQTPTLYSPVQILGKKLNMSSKEHVPLFACVEKRRNIKKNHHVWNLCLECNLIPYHVAYAKYLLLKMDSYFVKFEFAVTTVTGFYEQKLLLVHVNVLARQKTLKSLMDQVVWIGHCL